MSKFARRLTVLAFEPYGVLPASERFGLSEARAWDSVRRSLKPGHSAFTRTFRVRAEPMCQHAASSHR